MSTNFEGLQSARMDHLWTERLTPKAILELQNISEATFQLRNWVERALKAGILDELQMISIGWIYSMDLGGRLELVISNGNIELMSQTQFEKNRYKRTDFHPEYLLSLLGESEMLPSDFILED